MNTHDLIIIGGGPAAYTAAMYAARAMRAPLCIEGFEAGGQLLITAEVENFPGFPDGIQGPDLSTRIRQQAERFGASFLMRDVTRVDFSSRPFRLWVGDETYQANAVIVATGARARSLGLPSELALQNHGVAYCSVCDGPFFAGRRVAVVGGGDAALEEALSLAKLASEVLVVHRRRELRASRIMQEYAAKVDKIELLVPYVVDEVLGVDEGQVTGVRLRDVESGEERVEDVAGLFVSIGHDPNTELFRDWLHCDERGYVRVERGSTRTNVDGVFAAGDVQDHVYRQAVTSAGSGCMAAIDADRWLSHNAFSGDATPVSSAV